MSKKSANYVLILTEFLVFTPFLIPDNLNQQCIGLDMEIKHERAERANNSRNIPSLKLL